MAVNGNTVILCETSIDVQTDPILVTGYIWALDKATGKSLWQTQGTDLVNVFVPPSGPYLLASSFADKTNAVVEMIDASKKGARGWKKTLPADPTADTPGWPQACLAGGSFVFGAGSDALFAVDPATGVEKWHQHFDSVNGDVVELGVPFASLDGATVFVPVGADLAALSSADGSFVWVAELTGSGADGGANLFNGNGTSGRRDAQCTADTVFLTDFAKNLWAIDAATGRARWKYNDPGQPDSGFLWTVGGGQVFIASNLTVTAIAAHG